MKLFQSIQKLLVFIFIAVQGLYAQDCPSLNPNNYGDCSYPLGYVWSENDCYLVNGCNAGDDSEYFFTTYEGCQLECNPVPSVGDLNNDSNINLKELSSINIFFRKLFTEV